MPPKTSDRDLVAEILKTYASRGVFRGFSEGASKGSTAAFRMLWHQNQFFDLVLDTKKRNLKFPIVLPQVPARSKMYREFKEFVESRFAKDLPPHRRIDPRKLRISLSNNRGNVALTATVIGGDFDYGTRRLIHLVHETYLTFLNDGRYYHYLIDTFDLDPDRI